MPRPLSPAYRAALAFRTISDNTGFFENLHRHEARLNREYLRCRRELLNRIAERTQKRKNGDPEEL